MSSEEPITAEKQSTSVAAYLEEQHAIVRSGKYWDCLKTAQELSERLLGDGRRPWIARLRKTQLVGDQVFHGPLIPRIPGIKATWTTHYVSCCDGIAYDPLAGKPLPLETYTLEVFGEEIPTEVFVPPGALQSFRDQR